MEYKAELGEFAAAVAAAVAEVADKHIMQRMWEHDHTIWQDDPDEITNRLGWLDIAQRLRNEAAEMTEYAQALQAEGYTHALLMGMGGSSLAPELFSLIFGADQPGLGVSVLDSTDPGMVLAYAEMLDPTKTLYIVSTKSGGTTETLSFFKYFYNYAACFVPQTADGGAVGRHFIAITDPGSKLVKLAEQYAFRHTYQNDPNIGGRYSALSYFGLVPAALAGADVGRLLDSAIRMAEKGELAAEIGATWGALAKLGRDKLTLSTSAELASFGDWAEQLVAESLGKSGTGILPVVGETLGAPEVYGADRVFVDLRLADDTAENAERDLALDALAAAGHPVLRITLQDRYDLGGQFLLWEMATAVAGERLRVHPFNQPNVEAAKDSARAMVDAFHKEGKLPESEAAAVSGAALADFLSQARAGDYIALQAYVLPTAETTAVLRDLQTRLRNEYKQAVTVGYGPRFLHSTGQLHKGDAGNGLFVQFTSDPEQDAPIPDEAGNTASTMSFGVLKLAQALGDGQALRDVDRRVVRFHISGDVPEALAQLL